MGGPNRVFISIIQKPESFPFSLKLHQIKDLPL
jgi:hypothetical protein